jgi:hypothetical protein
MVFNHLSPSFSVVLEITTKAAFYCCLLDNLTSVLHFSLLNFPSFHALFFFLLFCLLFFAVLRVVRSKYLPDKK